MRKEIGKEIPFEKVISKIKIHFESQFEASLIS